MIKTIGFFILLGIIIYIAQKESKLQKKKLKELQERKQCSNIRPPEEKSCCSSTCGCVNKEVNGENVE